MNRPRATLLAGASVCLLGSAVCAYIALPVYPEGFFAVRDVLDLGKLKQGQTIDGTFDLLKGKILTNLFYEPSTRTS